MSRARKTCGEGLPLVLVLCCARAEVVACAVGALLEGMPGTPAVQPVVATRVPARDTFPCGTCGLLFDDRPDLMSHYKGELHRVNLQRKVRDLEPLSHEQFQQREAAQAEAPQDKLEARTQRQEARLEQQLQADAGQAQGPRRRAPLLLASTQCIFSREHFDSLEAAVAHMKKQYGFFIPDSEYLTDLRGLMHFLREQVVTHHRCWYCARVGRSYEATVQHMVDKSHCKLPIDGSYPDLAPYYDFGADHGATDAGWVRVNGADTDASAADDVDANLCRPVSAPYCPAADAAAAQAERLRKLAPPPVARPQAGEDGNWERVEHYSSSDEAAEELPMPRIIGPTELVLPDGRVLGHRSMQRYYRQAPRPVMAPRTTDDQVDEQVRLQDGEDASPGDVDRSSNQLQDGAQQPGRRVVAAGPPPIDKAARSEQTKGDVRRDKQRYKASEARGKVAGGRAVMWQVGL